MNQPPPPYGTRGQQLPPIRDWQPPGNDVYPTAYPQVEQGSGAFRYVVLACGTLVVLGVLVLAGLMLVPRAAVSPVVVAGGTTADGGSPVIATVAAPSSVASVPVGGYSCGSTGSGHTVVVENGTVPCDHALTVAAQWLSTGSTPEDGEGPAGTMYSWTCASSGDGGGWCTSKMGSHLAIGA